MESQPSKLNADTQPYAVEREIEDIEALIEASGGSASLYGVSSGAALAMEAAIGLGSRIHKLAMCEAPYTDDEAPIISSSRTIWTIHSRSPRSW